MSDEKLELYDNLLERVRVEAENNLAFYGRTMWPVVEPRAMFAPNWHIDCIADHLMAVTNGDLRNLIINIPPRHMKSLLACVFWPTWSWLKLPTSRWIFASYAEQLTKRDSLKCRRIIESDLYQDLFRPSWRLQSDQNEKMRFENTETGYRLATSVGGAATGEGGDFLVVDDPHKANQVHSTVQRERVIDWYREEFSSRGNDPKTVRKVIIMQRLHEKDLAGSLIEDGDWAHLMIPARYEPKRSFATNFWKDPRTEDGQLLWPDRMGETELAALAKEMGSMAAQGQLQQDPRPGDGGMFKRQWWKMYKELPAPGQWRRLVQFTDGAQEPGISNDYSVTATWLETDAGYYLLDLWRAKVEMPQLESAAIANASKHNPAAIVIENKASGVGLRQTLMQRTSLPIIKFEPGQNSKVVRAAAATPTVEAGNCFLPEAAPWVEDFIQEHEKFPLGSHDDQVDTTSMMVEYFKKHPVPTIRVRRA